MKKVYEAPFAEKVEFNYSEVVAQSKTIGEYYSDGHIECKECPDNSINR